MHPFKFIAITTMIVVFSACQNHSTEQHEDFFSDTTQLNENEKARLVKTAFLKTKVKDVEESTHEITKLSEQYGGMVYTQSIQFDEEDSKEFIVSSDSMITYKSYRPTADLLVRIPSEKLHSFLYETSKLGYNTEKSSLTIEDKSLIYLEHKLKQENRNSLPIKTGTINTIRIKDESTDHSIANMLIDADVSYSVVNIELFQNSIVRKETISNYHIEKYNLPFSVRFSNALHNGIDIFRTLILFLANLWTIILIGILVFLGWKYYKRRLIVVTE